MRSVLLHSFTGSDCVPVCTDDRFSQLLAGCVDVDLERPHQREAVASLHTVRTGVWWLDCEQLLAGCVDGDLGPVFQCTVNCRLN